MFNRLPGHWVGMIRLPLGWLVISHVLASLLERLSLFRTKIQGFVLQVSEQSCHLNLFIHNLLIGAHLVFLISAHSSKLQKWDKRHQ